MIVDPRGEADNDPLADNALEKVSGRARRSGRRWWW